MRALFVAPTLLLILLRPATLHAQEPPTPPEITQMGLDWQTLVGAQSHVLMSINALINANQQLRKDRDVAIKRYTDCIADFDKCKASVPK